jgi:hypothetical protein
VTSTDDTPWRDVPEADQVEQLTPVDDSGDDDGLDPNRLASATEADPADVMEQSRTDAGPDEDEEWPR